MTHWCAKHKTAWFRKGKMKGFAHPVLNDQTGEPTGEWCNEPGGEDTQASDKPAPKVAYGQDSPEKRRSIERQTAAQIAFEYGINDEDTLDKPSPWTLRKALIQAEQVYQWIANGTIPESPKTSNKPPLKAGTPTTVTTKTEGEPSDTKSTQETTDLGIDLDWLKESLGKLQWTTVIKWLRDKYPQATGAKVSEIVRSLTLDQRKEFANEVQTRLKAG